MTVHDVLSHDVESWSEAEAALTGIEDDLAALGAVSYAVLCRTELHPGVGVIACRLWP